MFEKEFKQVDYNGSNFHIWSEITTKDNKSSAGARIQILPYVLRGLVLKKKRATRRTSSRASTNHQQELLFVSPSARRITTNNNNSLRYADNQPTTSEKPCNQHY